MQLRKLERDNQPRKLETSTSTSNARALERDIETLMDYAAAAGLADTPAVRAMADRYLRGGMEMGVLMAAMDETMLAPRPSWQYWAAIVGRCFREGYHTMEAWETRREQFAASRRPHKPDIWAGVD